MGARDCFAALTRKKECFEPRIACESAIFHLGRVGRPAGDELAMTAVALLPIVVGVGQLDQGDPIAPDGQGELAVL